MWVSTKKIQKIVWMVEKNDLSKKTKILDDIKGWKGRQKKFETTFYVFYKVHFFVTRKSISNWI